MFKQQPVGGFVIDHVERDDFLALGDDDLARGSSETECIFSAKLCFCVNGFLDLDVFLRKKLLRFGATRSPSSVIIPVDSLGHGRPFSCERTAMLRTARAWAKPRTMLVQLH